MNAAGTDAAPSRRLGLLYDVAVVATAGLLLGFLYLGVNVALYASAAAGAIAAYLLGYLSLQRRWTGLGRGTIRYGKLWFWMTVFSGLSLISGKIAPMLFFGGMGTGLTLLFWIGGWTGTRVRAE